jgi:predicted amidohydrolase YtcJ
MVNDSLMEFAKKWFQKHGVETAGGSDAPGEAASGARLVRTCSTRSASTIQFITLPRFD